MAGKQEKPEEIVSKLRQLEGQKAKHPVDALPAGTRSPSAPFALSHCRQALGVSERRACRTLGQHRSAQRKTRMAMGPGPKRAHWQSRPRCLSRHDAERYGRRMSASGKFLDMCTHSALSLKASDCGTGFYSSAIWFGARLSSSVPSSRLDLVRPQNGKQQQGRR